MSGVTRRVLIVEDDAQIVTGAVLRLKASGFDTLVARNGLEGVVAAKEHHPDVILLDMRMPEQDGLQTLEQLQSAVETSDIPVVMLSASLGDRNRSLHAGARLFMSKPYDPMRLIAAVSQVIDEAQQSDGG